MKELIEKIVEILETTKQVHLNYHIRPDYLIIVDQIFDDVFDIIHKEAKAYNDGWIPVDQRLPDRINPFQTSEYTVTMRFVKNGKKGRPFTSHASFDFEADKWLIKDYEVIAWREQIAPYQPKGE